MKLESLVIADQHTAVNMYAGIPEFFFLISGCTRNSYVLCRLPSLLLAEARCGGPFIGLARSNREKLTANMTVVQIYFLR